MRPKSMRCGKCDAHLVWYWSGVEGGTPTIRIDAAALKRVKRHHRCGVSS